MENGKFWPPTESKPLNRSTKKLAHVITSGRRHPEPNLVQIGPRGANRWNITLLTFLFIYRPIYLFSETHLQVRPLNGFWRAMAQKTRSHARMCLFGVKNVEINNEPLFMPPKRQILAKKVELKNFLPKTLYMIYIGPEGCVIVSTTI